MFGTILLIACLTSLATVLPGSFLVLRGVALMSDAISHAIVLGIALTYWLTKSLMPPLLMLGAIAAGIATVVLTELLIKTKHLKHDAATGLVFPFFFSIGVIIISTVAKHVHLDLDMVLLGDLALAPFQRLTIQGTDYGPVALWTIGALCIVNALIIGLFFKELLLATFDETAAYLSNFKPTALYYLLMVLTSITAVGAFDIVGSIVVVALMIIPPATAHLLAKNLTQYFGLSLLFAVSASLGGLGLAHLLDCSIAGSIATTNGIIFFTAWLFKQTQP